MKPLKEASAVKKSSENTKSSNKVSDSIPDDSSPLDMCINEDNSDSILTTSSKHKNKKKQANNQASVQPNNDLSHHEATLDNNLSHTLTNEIKHLPKRKSIDKNKKKTSKADILESTIETKVEAASEAASVEYQKAVNENVSLDTSKNSEIQCDKLIDSSAEHLKVEDQTDSSVAEHSSKETNEPKSESVYQTEAEKNLVKKLNDIADLLNNMKNYIPNVGQRRNMRINQPRLMATNLPSCFPVRPLKNSATQQFFTKLDFDTLFFAFYFQQGTCQQYLAARELKRNNWWFHKKYLRWFHPQTDAKLDPLGGNTYVYFDNESGWCSRIKNGFIFEPCFLENEVEAASDEPVGPDVSTYNLNLYDSY